MLADVESKVGGLHLVVVTPYGTFYEGDVDFVVLPNSDGERGVYPNRAPYVGAIYPGSLRFEVNGSWSYAFVSNGYVQVGHNYVIVICNAAEWADAIDTVRATNHIVKNEARLKQEGLTYLQKKMYNHSIRRNKRRLFVSEQFLKLKGEDEDKKALSSEAIKVQRKSA